MKKYDLVVIGSGSGLNIISHFLDKNKKIALIENDKMGGTCLNRGCIPSKILLSHAEIINQIKSSDKFFIKSKITKINFKKIVKTTNREINKYSNEILEFYKHTNKVDFYKEKAAFLDNNTITVGDKTIYGKNIVINIGARAFIPNIDGLNKIDFLSYKEAMKIEKLPKDLIIIGGGYIGVELAEFFASMGTKVTILEAKRLLSNVDIKLTNELKKEFSKKVKVFEKAKVKKVRKEKNKIAVYFNDKKVVAQKLLIATGIKANTDSIDIENTDIQLDSEGFIKVDKYMKSTVKHIYALGDCINSYFFKHSANFEANFILKNLFKKKQNKINYPPIGYAVFSSPEISGVGISLSESKNSNYYVKESFFKDTARSMALKNSVGRLFLIFEKKSKILKGAHFVGPNASILIHVLIGLITTRATEDDLKKMIYIHPTLPEVIKIALI